MRQRFYLPNGYRLEFWASGDGFFRISRDADTLWQVPSFSGHPEFYTYHHREACEVTVEWDNPEAILWAYGNDPQTVQATGITVWEFGADGVKQRTGPEIDAWMRAEPARPQMHYAPIRQWMNDPNGLCKVGDIWHLFYQFHPAGTDWGPMHWGHATSRNLFDWMHLPVFLHPEQNCWRLGATGGAFSGNAFQDRDGSRMFFYTERLPAYDLFKGYREVQKIARPAPDLITAEAISLAIEQRPDGVEHDFRDPKVWWDDGAQAYRMVLGAALHGDPAVLLYGSDDLRNWRYLGPLYRAPSRFRAEGARAVECPDFFQLDGNWVLIMGFVGHTDPASGRHNLLYALVGAFEGDSFLPGSADLQLLDFGTDFYAMQTFEADGRQIGLAWLFNWEDRKPAGSPYSGEMSLPRALSLDQDNRLCMRPAAELDAAWPSSPLNPVSDGIYKLGEAPLDLTLDGPLAGTTITATQDGALSFEVRVDAGILSTRLPQDDGSIRYSADIGFAKDLRIIHDRGIVEVFAADGAVCGTRRNYTKIAPDQLLVRTISEVSASVRGRV